MADDFKYDIAISVLDRDLDLAEELRGRLAEDITVFLYSERQVDLAGEDGMVRFTEAFRRDSRVAAVLARKEWGGTKWTRVEETAVRSRGFEEGWDFLVFVALDGKESVPDWVPVTYIWAEINRLGTGGLAALLERKVQERGKAVRPESVKDVHDRIERRRRAERDRQTFLESHEGVRAAEQEFETLWAHWKGEAPGLGMRASQDSTRVCVLTKDVVSLSASWYRHYGNTLSESQLTVRLWDGVLSDHVASEFRAKKYVSELRLLFDRVGETVGWRVEATAGRFWPTTELADHCLAVLLKWADGEEIRL